jgi:hypothetical protein
MHKEYAQTGANTTVDETGVDLLARLLAGDTDWDVMEAYRASLDREVQNPTYPN